MITLDKVHKLLYKIRYVLKAAQRCWPSKCVCSHLKINSVIKKYDLRIKQNSLGIQWRPKPYLFKLCCAHIRIRICVSVCAVYAMYDGCTLTFPLTNWIHWTVNLKCVFCGNPIVRRLYAIQKPAYTKKTEVHHKKLPYLLFLCKRYKKNTI